ncbi:hypothetical protein BX616_007689 [Lobosporangium transversale]|uniref:GST N-terminal domain-containing protein n=1 Tax=Lobosporangium transversale TaxID=64571 RepID=A0A1Y2GIW9_9FUNG|nr:hypothetical protein BCR41DRAFT_339651 [Lobosporangium transversale]KAF9896318.1 hypothetical protein BX616_007689 [Lobosporangium transversale]ORZ08787.1 hypothetical protein BCR41DRAFT_339651 [Lobosporangium transversale]|eukprot:XP_021878570.1 hypothetical protein BCR41DRAFT_339651 [Lobosporangium transversale]
MTVDLKLFELVDSKTRKVSFSPAVWRAKFALNYKKITYESVPLTFLEIPTVITAACPNVISPTVPTLQLEPGNGLPDSFAIAEYIEEQYPDRPLLFGKNISEKNLQRFFESYVQSKIHPPIRRMVYNDMYSMQDEKNADYFRTSREKSSGQPHHLIAGDRNQNLRELKESLGLVHTALQSGDWILGPQPGWADFVLGASFMWFNSCSPNDFKEGILEAFDDQIMLNYWKKMQEYVY